MYWLILFFFLLSGTLGLGYQVLWSKYVLEFIGVSAYSYATVLATFMGGLALGSQILGQWVDRTKTPLKVYAYLELAIGLYAFAYQSLSESGAIVYGRLVSCTPDHAAGGMAVWGKVGVSVLLLLPPTFLMGGTYPALLKHASETWGRVGKRASQLYSANSAGAIVGALLVAFVLMPWLGKQMSLWLLGTANAAIGFSALLVSRKRSKLPVPVDENTLHPVLPRTERLLILVLIGIEGLTAFLLEVGWTRFFALILGSSTYSFAIMLAAFITGIALGSGLLSKIHSRIRNPLRVFGWTQILAAAFLIATLPLYQYLPWIFKRFNTLLSSTVQHYYLFELGKLMLCYVVMLPPAIFIGMAVPLMIQAIANRPDQVGRDSGYVYAWNTWGNVIGATWCGLILLPLLGTERVIRLTAFIMALVGFFALVGGPARTAREVRVAFGALILTAVLSWSLPAWDPGWFTLFPFRRTDQVHSLEEARNKASRGDVLFVRDDPAAHIMVQQLHSTGALSLFVNGKIDASNILTDMSTQVLSAQIPMILHENPQDVLVIGLAAGVTTGSVLTHKVSRVDTVEIVRAMTGATRLFGEANHHVLSNPGFHLVVDDGRSYLMCTERKYDVIISEPSNPWLAGGGNLFSSDFYPHARAALRPGGFFVQWVQAYELSDQLFTVIVRTMRSRFPFVYGFQGAAKDVILIGTDRPIKMNWARMRSKLQNPFVQDDLARVGVDSLSALIFLSRFSPETVNVLASMTDRQNTDDNLLLEYGAPRDLFLSADPLLPDQVDERKNLPPVSMWHHFSEQNPGEVDVLSMVRMIVFTQSRRSAMVRTTSMGILGGQDPMLPVRLRDMLGEDLRQLPPGQTAIAARLREALSSGQYDTADAILKQDSPGILLLCTLSAGNAVFWRRESGELLGTAKSFDPELLRFRIDVLAATGQTREAAEELLNWARSDHPPDSRWAVLRAAQLGQGPALDNVIQAYRARGGTFFLSEVSRLSHQH